MAVYDGEVSEGKSIAVGCGRLKPPTVLSNGSYVEIYYKVRRQPYRGGFNVTVTEGESGEWLTNISSVSCFLHHSGWKSL